MKDIITATSKVAPNTASASWDQASLLTQIGLLDATNLPIKGIEQSEKLNELSSK